ncbi:alpha/beta hydrolase [Micromonospora soli]|uniref:alpha/beta fold hydrolase n=1 Tax=Micromonospora sp. NBRC 110009 TaxID=3061627 RepID=UPI0026737CF4|nr:alpha/beta hydrolase [Micromonospora sp. NBRC 110009]WKT99736.1 alpha/beta hydrolase [Micromonospora sp. NBRC 110009]
MRVPRGPYHLHAEVRPGSGPAVVLLHGLPDNLHLYDRVVPLLPGRCVVRFDFLGWGRSDKPARYPYTADNQAGDLLAVLDHLELRDVVLVAHDASGPPAIDVALMQPERVARLVLLNTYYHATVGLRRPPAIALYSTPGLGPLAQALARRRPALHRRLFHWQVGRFIRDPAQRGPIVSRLWADFPAETPAFWRLNDDLLGTVLRRRRRLPDLRRFDRPVDILFGAADRYLNPRVALAFVRAFPDARLRLVPGAGHYVQVDAPEAVASVLLDQGPAQLPHRDAATSRVPASPSRGRPAEW